MLPPSTLPTPVELFADQQDGDLLTYPTGGLVFRVGDPVDAIYALQRGMVELSTEGEPGKLRYSAGEIFSYEDLAGSRLVHSHDARALTPVEVVRLTLPQQHPVRRKPVFFQRRHVFLLTRAQVLPWLRVCSSAAAVETVVDACELMAKLTLVLFYSSESLLHLRY